MKLIAIVGKKRSGKDTCADFVSNEMNSTKYQLAAPIKRALYRAYQVRFAGDKSHPELTFEDWEGDGKWDRERPLVMNNREAEDLLQEALSFLARHHRLDFFNGGNDKVHDFIKNNVLNNNEPWSIRRFMQTLGTDLVVDCLDRMFWMKLFADKYFDNMYSEFDYFVVPDVRQKHEIETLRAMGATIIHVVRSDTADNEDTHITELGLPIHETDSVIFNDGSVEDLYTSLKEILK